jgi:predicted HicB family RNase H-like nuclease
VLFLLCGAAGRRSHLKRSTPPPEGTTRMNLHVPTELHTRLKLVAVQQKTTMTDLLLELIEQYVNKHEGRGKKGRR